MESFDKHIIELTPIADESDEPEFDFSSPEDVIIEVIDHGEEAFTGSYGGWSRRGIETINVINGKAGVIGAASYEKSYGGFLDYTITDMIDAPEEGWWVIEGVTGVYRKGDGWMTDDDMEFDYVRVRRATEDEIKQA